MSNDRASRHGGLSAAGAARKEAILATLHERLDVRVRRRKAARAAVTAAAMIVLAAGVWIALPGAPQAGAPGRGVQIADGASEIHGTPESIVPDIGLAGSSPGRVTVRIVSTPSVDAVPCGTSPAVGICLLSDEQLLAALAEAGQPSGLVRVGDRTVIVPQNGRSSELD